MINELLTQGRAVRFLSCGGGGAMGATHKRGSNEFEADCIRSTLTIEAMERLFRFNTSSISYLETEHVPLNTNHK